VTIHVVDIVQYTHTCHADPASHVVDIHRTLIDVIDGGPCRTPTSYRLDGRIHTIPCGRRVPSDDQCPACRIIVTQRTITSIHRGHQDSHPASPDTGAAA
jgi:hypothetical protein